MLEQSASFAALERLAATGWRPTAAIDGGAYKGEWTRAVQRIWPETPTLMIEAQPKLAAALTLEQATIGRDIVVVDAALHAQSGLTLPFHLTDYYGNTTGASFFAEISSVPRRTIMLTSATLDEVASNWSGSPFQLLKLDLQGAELAALDGARHVLETIQIIQLELSLLPYNEGAPLFAEAVARLAELGFSIYDIGDQWRGEGRQLHQMDALFVRRSGLRRLTPQPG